MELSQEKIYCEVCVKTYIFESTCIHITKQRKDVFEELYNKRLAVLSAKPSKNQAKSARKKNKKKKGNR